MTADDQKEGIQEVSLATGLSEVKSIFNNIGLFKGLSGEELGEIVHACKQAHIGPGEVLFEQGDQSDALFIVGHGELEVVGRSEMGEKVVLAILGQGTVVGEMSLIEGGPRSATVRSVSECDIFRLEREAFDKLRAQRRPVAYKVILGLAATVGERRRQTDARIQEVFNDPASHIDAFESQLHEMVGRLRKS